MAVDSQTAKLKQFLNFNRLLLLNRQLKISLA